MNVYRDIASYPDDQAHGRIHKYYLWYTLLFIVLMTGMFLPFLLNGKSFVWTPDGTSQYFPQMVYLRRYLREAFSGLIHGDFRPLFYDFTIGMGDGIIVTARINRIDILSALVPASMLGVFYNFTVLLRLYLGGLFFSILFRYRKMDDRAILTGTIVYTSCGFAMCRVTMYPVFGIALYTLPFMLFGVEKILQEDKMIWMIIAVTVAFLGNYYFPYMNTIAVGFYFLFRWPSIRRKVPMSSSPVAVFFSKGFRTLGGWLVGVGMQACILIPTFNHVFSSDRVHVEETSGIPFLYPVKYMVSLVLGFISPNIKPGYSTVVSMIALVVPILVFLYCDHFPKLNALRAALLLEAAGLFLPFVGLVMGAFGNVSNRWVFIFAFTLGISSIYVVQKGPAYGVPACRVLAVITSLYAAGSVALFILRRHLGISSLYCLYVAVGAACLTVSSLVFLILRRRQPSYQVYSFVITVLAILCAAVMGFVTFQPGLGNVSTTYMAMKELPSYYDSQPVSRLHALKDGVFSRTDTGYNKRLWLNNSLYHDYYGVSGFNSVANGNLQDFLLQLESPGIESNVRIMSMGGSTVCENLACVGYYLTDRKDGIIPYGFSPMPEHSDKKNILYRNQNPLYFARTYDSAVSSATFDNLSAAQKEQSLIKTVVLDEADLTHLPDNFVKAKAPETHEICIPLDTETAAVNGSLEKKENGGFVLGPESEITFPVERRQGCESYIHLTGVSYEDAYVSKDDESITLYSGAGKRKLFLRSDDNPYQVPIKGWLSYMGYSETNGHDEIRIRLNGKGRCKIRSAEIVYIPMNSFEEDVAKRNHGGCSEPVLSANTVEGDLEDGGQRFVELSLLYSDGWSAEVDGAPVLLMRSNLCYTGFYVSEGAHHFKLTYSPPHMKPAIVITLLSWLIFVLVLIRTIKRSQALKKS